MAYFNSITRQNSESNLRILIYEKIEDDYELLANEFRTWFLSNVSFLSSECQMGGVIYAFSIDQCYIINVI